MGYWSQHPLGGDDPQDQIANFIGVLFPDIDDVDELTLNTVQKFILEKIGEISEKPMAFNIYDEYILPFLIAEFKIQIKDKGLSEKIKEMIEDAGSYKFGDEVPQNGDDDFPSKENNWNELSSSFDYGRKLYDLWDQLMNGSISFEQYPSEGIDSFNEEFFGE